MSAEQRLFRIGAVARLSGVTPDTLRVWERRYRVVSPNRSSGRTRLYSEADLEKLCLIKSLVDAGHGIGTLAGLTADQLRERLRLKGRLRSSAPGSVRVAMLGPRIASWASAVESLPGLELSLVSLDRDQFVNKAQALKPDVIVLEFPTLHDHTSSEIQKLLDEVQGFQAIIVYQFGHRKNQQRLEAAGLTTLRFPFDVQHFRRVIFDLALAEGGQDFPYPVRDPVQPRRFSNAELIRLSQAGNRIRCECPKHLSAIIMELATFETYSLECESKDEADAALHAYLHRCTAMARQAMEQALAKSIEIDGLDRPDE